MVIVRGEFIDRCFLLVWSCVDGYRVKNDGFFVNVGLLVSYKYVCFVCDGVKFNY